MDLDTLQRDAERHPDDPLRWWRLGVALGEQSRRGGDATNQFAAIAALMHASSIAGPAELVGRIAVAFADLGELDAARDSLLRVKDAADAATAAPHYERVARALLDGGRALDALELLRQAGPMGDGEDKLTLLRIHAAAATGEVDAALDELDAILLRRPDQWDAHVVKARLLADQGRAVECIAAWTAATRLRPESSQALSGLGAALAAAERYEEAVEFLTRVAQLNPTSSDAYLDLAAVLRKAHQLEDAEWAARSAVEVAPSSAHAHHDLGLVLEAAGQLDEAVASYREAIGRRGDWTPPYLALARVLERTGRIEDAIHTLEKAAALPSADSDTQAEISAALAGLRARAPNQRAFAGRLDAFSMWQILELLQNHRSTGHLELSIEGSVTEIFVRAGHLVRIVSDHAPRLAEIVPAVPGVDARRLAAVMDGYQQQSDARVAQHLLHFGVLDATKLRAAMETRLRTALDRILDCDDGTFTFQRQTVEPSATDVDLDIRFVLLDIVRSRDAAATGGGAEVADDDDQEVRLIDSETRPPKQPG